MFCRQFLDRYQTALGMARHHGKSLSHSQTHRNLIYYLVMRQLLNYYIILIFKYLFIQNACATKDSFSLRVMGCPAGGS